MDFNRSRPFHLKVQIVNTQIIMFLFQEPQCLYDEVKVVPLIKLDRNATDRQIKKYIEDEEGR